MRPEVIQMVLVACAAFFSLIEMGRRYFLRKYVWDLLDAHPKLERSRKFLNFWRFLQEFPLVACAGVITLVFIVLAFFNLGNLF